MPAQAYMLVSTEQGQIDQVSGQLMEFKEIENIHQLYGPWDMIVTIKTESMADLRDFLGKVRQTEGVTGTETMICSDVF